MTALHGLVQVGHGRAELGVSKDGDCHLIGGRDYRYPGFGRRGGQGADDWLGQRATDVKRQLRNLASRGHQINRDASPLSGVRTGPELVPELVRNVVSLDQIASQAGDGHRDLLPRVWLAQVDLTCRQAFEQVSDSSRDRLVPASPRRLNRLCGNVRRPSSGQLILR